MPAKKDESKTGKKGSKEKKKGDKGHKSKSPSETTAPTQYTEKEFPIVGIGASAGGLKALEKFFDNMPPKENIAFVVVQHLDPKHESLMAGLLEKHTEMKVSTVENEQEVEPNHLYLKPPGKDVIVKNRTLYLQKPREGKGVQLTIDIFFRSLAEDDMRNLFNATEIATLYLNDKLQIVRFTPAATGMFNLREQDIGRLVSDITGHFDTKILAQEAENVIQSLEKKEWDVHCEDDRWFSIRILPYRTTDNVIAGVVITVMEVTEARQVEHEAEKARASFQSILDSIPDPLLILDTEQKVLSASRSFYEFFDLKKSDTENMPLYKVGDGEWNIAELRSLLEKVLESGETVQNYKLEAEFSRVGQKSILLDADPIEEDRAEMVLLIIKEIKENG